MTCSQGDHSLLGGLSPLRHCFQTVLVCQLFVFRGDKWEAHPSKSIVVVQVDDPALRIFGVAVRESGVVRPDGVRLVGDGDALVFGGNEDAT